MEGIHLKIYKAFFDFLEILNSYSFFLNKFKLAFWLMHGNFAFSRIYKIFSFLTRTIHLPAWLASKTNRSSDDFYRPRHPLKCGPCPHTNETGNYSRAPASIRFRPRHRNEGEKTPPTTLYNSECRTSCRTVSWGGVCQA